MTYSVEPKLYLALFIPVRWTVTDPESRSDAPGFPDDTRPFHAVRNRDVK